MKEDNVLRRTWFDWFLELVAAVSLVAGIASLGFYGCFEAGEPFPMHFNAAGEVDKWGERSMLWKLVVLDVVLWGVFTVGERLQGMSIYPVTVTKENQLVLNRLCVRLMRILKAELVSLTAYLQYAGIWMALGRSKGLNMWVVGIFLMVFFCTIIVFAGKMIAWRNRNQ